MKLIDDLKWRYATKKFSNRRVTDKDLEKIIEAINLSTSSAISLSSTKEINTSDINKSISPERIGSKKKLSLQFWLNQEAFTIM